MIYTLVAQGGNFIVTQPCILIHSSCGLKWGLFELPAFTAPSCIPHIKTTQPYIVIYSLCGPKLGFYLNYLLLLLQPAVHLLYNSAIHCDLLSSWPQLGFIWITWFYCSILQPAIYLLYNSAIHCDLLTLWPQMGFYIRITCSYCCSLQSTYYITQPYIVIYSLCGPKWGLFELSAFITPFCSLQSTYYTTPSYIVITHLWPQTGFIWVTCSYCSILQSTYYITQPYIVIYSLCGPKWGLFKKVRREKQENELWRLKRKYTVPRRTA